jgi:hypothetical protein
MLTRQIFIAVSFAVFAQHAQAIIHYDGDDAGNLTAPASGAPFEVIARVCDNGGGSTRGSAIHLRGKYMLTANHVSLRSHVTFDGSTYWARDTSFSPITIGTADLKLFKLIEDPGLAEVTLHTTNSGDDVSSTTKIKGQWVTVDVIGTFIGWGRGRNESIADSGSGTDNIWAWGDNSTLAKRWGTNRIDNTLNVVNTPDYDYAALLTNIDSNAGNDEAAAAVYDSGSGIFIENNGNWTLAGLATLVSTVGSATFSTSGDVNYFVRIENYASAIEAAIPDTETYSGWQTDHSLYGADANNTADTDNDGIGQLHEFAFGGDPNENDLSILPTHELVEDGGSIYLEITLTRPKDLQGITYTPQTTTDLSNWPSDSTGIVDDTPTAVDNGDGTETLTYRRSQAVAGADHAFIRIDVSE